MRTIDSVISLIAKVISWLTILLILTIVIDVIFRYSMSITSAASFELEWHFFSAIFLLGSAYALQNDRHVRVDVFYQKFSEKRKAWVDIFGILLFLFPFCVITIWESLSFVSNSFEINETSPQPGGLPFRWIIKAAIPAGFGLLLLQGLSLLIKNFKILRN